MTSQSISKSVPNDAGHSVDIAVHRNDFPILSTKMNGKPLVYLDSASSAQKPQVVLDSFERTYKINYSNIHRGLYNFSQVITEEYESVRIKIVNFINAPSDNEIIFTRNTTEAINLVATSWGEKNLQRGDEVIISEMEHHANIVPWQLLANKKGIIVKTIPVKDDGTLSFGSFVSLLSQKTRFISIVHASNMLGTVNPVEKMIKTAKNFDKNIKILVDGSQSVVHRAINVEKLGCDFFAFTGHKLYGPNGVGVLWGKYEILNDMPPYQSGGDMIETVSFKNETTFKAPPARFEAGTPAIAEVIALGAAIDYISHNVGMKVIETHEKHLLNFLMEQLDTVEGLTYYGTAEDKVGVVSFTADWAHPSDIAMILDQCGVAVRTGHHCCMPLMERFGIDATVRVSLGLYSNENDIMVLVKSLQKAKDMLS